MPTPIRTAIAAILLVLLATPVAQGAVAPQPQFDRGVMKETYAPIGHFKPGDLIPSPNARFDDLITDGVFNPSGKFNAFDTNVYETIYFPSRQADDQTADDEPGSGIPGMPMPEHGICPPSDPAFTPYGKCANHQLEWLDHYERTMKTILKDFGVVTKRYKFESPGSGEAGRPGSPGTTSTPGGDSYNISATVPGADNPEEQIIVSGHFDFTDSGPAATWDSAEGHAQVIRMAAIMAEYWRKTGTRPSATVKFMPWDQEETGTVGSTVWVRDNVPPGHESKIRGYFNVDPCAGAYPAYYHGNPGLNRIPMVLQLADPANKSASDAARIQAFNERAVTIVDEFFQDIDDTVEVIGGTRPLYTDADRGEIIPAIGGLLLFSSDYRNFEAIGVPFMNLSPDMFGPKADPAANSPRQSNEGIGILHTPNDNQRTLNRLTGPDQTGTMFSDGWIKGMELCAQLESRYMLQPEMGGAQVANMESVAYFEALPNEAIKGQNVDFDASGSYRYDSLAGTRDYADDLVYEWDFGDGTKGTGKTVQHSYAEVGKYDATLTVRSGGSSDTMTLPITVIGSTFLPPELNKPEPEDPDGTFPLAFDYKAGEREDLKSFVIEEAPDATSLLSDDASDIAKNWVVQPPDTDAITPWAHSDEAPDQQVRGGDPQGPIVHSEPRSFYTGVPPGENNVPRAGPAAGTSVLDIKEPIQLPKGDVELVYWSDFKNDANDVGRLEVAVDTGDSGVEPEYSIVDFVGRNIGDSTCGVECPASGPQFEQRRVDLTSFGGRKVRLRFVYSLGAPQFVNVIRAGWYIDDISITTGTFKAIGETPEKTFSVDKRPNGTYAYRVRAKFADNVTSSPSNVETVKVTNSSVGPGGNGNPPGGSGNPPGGSGNPPGGGPTACVAGTAFKSATARPAKRGGLRLRFSRAAKERVTIEVFRTSKGRRATNPVRVARFTKKTRSFTWNGRVRGRKAPPGVYFVRYKSKLANGAQDVRRVVLERKRGKFRVTKPFSERASCGLLRTFVLSSPTFGGKKRKTLVTTYRVGSPATVRVDVFRGAKSKKPIKRFKAVSRPAGPAFRVRFPARARRRGIYRVKITVRAAGGQRVVRTLYSRLL